MTFRQVCENIPNPAAIFILYIVIQMYYIFKYPSDQAGTMMIYSLSILLAGVFSYTVATYALNRHIGTYAKTQKHPKHCKECGKFMHKLITIDDEDEWECKRCNRM